MNLKNTTLIIIGIVLLAIIFIVAPYLKPKSQQTTNGTPTQTDTSSKPRDGWSRYTDTKGIWTIDAASTTRIIVDKQAMALIGYIPTCDPATSVVCIAIDKTLIPNSNFQGAAVSVQILSATSSAACLSKNELEQATTGITLIQNVPFQTFTAGDAAMSHQSSGTDYRAWHRNTCYGIGTRINTTSFEVYEAGTVKKFTDTDRAFIQGILSDTVSSFTFLK